jgi:hypothetical protein
MCVLVKDLVDVCVRVVVLFAVARYVRCRHLRAKRVGGPPSIGTSTPHKVIY